MSLHFLRDLEDLQRDILKMCAMVAALLHDAVAAIKHPNLETARKIFDSDNAIDEFDVRIEESCLKILALHQPVARDLRQVATVFKISHQLERVADLGVSIAERAASLTSLPPLPIPGSLEEMSRQAVSMLDRSLLAYIESDSYIAREICGQDETIDAFNREIIAELTGIMKAQPHLVRTVMHLFSACRNVERVADHATNIAEDVIYLVEARIVRHQLASVKFRRDSA